MLAIGRALIAKPRLMLLDEPSLGLSPLLVEEIFGIIARINAEQGVSMLLVEQNASVALAVAHYGYIMETGKIVIDGPAERLADDPDVREFYLGLGGSGAQQELSATSSTTSAASAGCREPDDGRRCQPRPHDAAAAAARTGARWPGTARHAAEGFRHLAADHLGRLPPARTRMSASACVALGLAPRRPRRRAVGEPGRMGPGAARGRASSAPSPSASIRPARRTKSPMCSSMPMPRSSSARTRSRVDKVLECVHELPHLRRIVVIETKGPARLPAHGPMRRSAFAESRRRSAHETAHGAGRVDRRGTGRRSASPTSG